MAALIKLYLWSLLLVDTKDPDILSPQKSESNLPGPERVDYSAWQVTRGGRSTRARFMDQMVTEPAWSHFKSCPSRLPGSAFGLMWSNGCGPHL